MMSYSRPNASEATNQGSYIPATSGFYNDINDPYPSPFNTSMTASNNDSLNISNTSTKRPLETIQKKLQRAYQEKNIMLQQIQSLRKQVQDNDSQILLLTNKTHGDMVLSMDRQRDVPSEQKATLNRLLEANIRAGTLACLWCLKTQVIKKLSQAFYHWKLIAAMLPPKPMSASKRMLLLKQLSNENESDVSDLEDDIDSMDEFEKKREMLCKSIHDDSIQSPEH